MIFYCLYIICIKLNIILLLLLFLHEKQASQTAIITQELFKELFKVPFCVKELFCMKEPFDAKEHHCVKEPSKCSLTAHHSEKIH